MEPALPDRRSAVKEKAGQYSAAVEHVLAEVASIRAAISILKAEEKRLLSTVGIELGENPFDKLLARIDSENSPTTEEINAVMSKVIPADLGSSAEPFYPLCEEIRRLRPCGEEEEEEEGDAPEPISLTPKNIEIIGVSAKSVFISWDGIEGREFAENCFYEIELSPQLSEKLFYHTSVPEYIFCNLKSATEYVIRVRVITLRGGNINCPWSKSVKVSTMRMFSDCTWKECPKNVKSVCGYSLDTKDPRIAKKTDGDSKYCTIVGNTPIPTNEVSSWKVNTLRTLNNGYCIYVGVAPEAIDQNGSEDNLNCGWYLHLWESKLFSGPPHNFRGRPYGPSKGKAGEYGIVKEYVKVVLNPANAELSFVLDGKNYGVAYIKIPIDKPLVPCVLLKWRSNTVKLEVEKAGKSKQNIF